MEHKVISFFNVREMRPYYKPVYKAMMQGDYGALYEMAEEIGDKGHDVVTFKFPGNFSDLHLVYNPKMMPIIDNQEGVEKSGFTKVLHYFSDEGGVFTTNGEAWQTRKQLTKKFFGKQRFDELEPYMDEHVAELISKWEEQGKVDDVYKDVSHFTFNLICDVMFGKELKISQENKNKFEKSIGFIGNNIFMLLTNIAGVVTKGKAHHFVPKKMQRNLESFREVMQTLIRDNPDNPIIRDFRKMHQNVAEGEEPDQKKIDDRLCDDFMQLMLESMETTSAALSWTLYDMAQHAKDTKDQDAHDGGSENMHYILESLRKHSVFAVALPRTCRENTVIGKGKDSFEIMAEDHILFPLQAMNKSIQSFVNPSEYSPERQSVKKVQARTKGSAFLTGAHACTGKDLYLKIAEKLVHSFQQELLSSNIISDYPNEKGFGTTVRPTVPGGGRGGCPFH